MAHSFPCIDSYRASLMDALTLEDSLDSEVFPVFLPADSFHVALIPSLQALFSCYEVDSDGVNIPEPPISQRGRMLFINQGLDLTSCTE